MRVETLDLSHYTDELASQYKRLSKTQIRLLASQVPESFIAKFSDEVTAVKELLDTIYATPENDYD
jgi:hypothetical protein